MIIGRGLISTVFEKEYINNDNVIIFASGVSNSKETREAEFNREFNLIKPYLSNKKQLVYFSTTSIHDKDLIDSPYVQHKLKMEALIKENCSNYLIFRTSNIIGAQGNKATIVNYLVEKIHKKENFDLWVSAKRNLLDVDDFGAICKLILKSGIQNEIINICNFNNISVLEMVQTIEETFCVKGVYSLKEKGGEVSVENDFLNSFLSQEFIDRLKSPNYFKKLLKKYYV